MSKVTAKFLAASKPSRRAHDNYWSYAFMLLMRNKLGKVTSDDFMGKMLAIINMGPKNKTKIPSSDDIAMEFSDETIREFETHYSIIKPKGPQIPITLSNTMNRRMELFLKLHLKDVKTIKMAPMISYYKFQMRNESYIVEETGLLIYIDKSMLLGKVSRIISVGVLAFTSDEQSDAEATPHTFLFALLEPLRKGQFEEKEVYPLGWYAPIVRPIEFERNEGVWYSRGYRIPFDGEED